MINIKPFVGFALMGVSTLVVSYIAPTRVTSLAGLSAFMPLVGMVALGIGAVGTSFGVVYNIRLDVASTTTPARPRPVADAPQSAAPPPAESFTAPSVRARARAIAALPTPTDDEQRQWRLNLLAQLQHQRMAHLPPPVEPWWVDTGSAAPTGTYEQPPGSDWRQPAERTPL